MDELINIIIETIDDSFLKPQYRKIVNRNKFTGHCYVATEALYYMLTDEEKSQYKPAIMKVNNITHWVLRNTLNGNIIDITREQFDFDLNYSTLKNAAFLTRLPSKRTQILLNKIYEKTDIQ